MVEVASLIPIIHVVVFVLTVSDIRKNKELFSGLLRWFLYVFVLFVPVGGAFLYLFLILTRKEPTSTCSHCGEPMPPDAEVCRACGYGSTKHKPTRPKRCRKCGETFDTFRGLHKHKQDHE
ncbi:MAG: zinc ribbon domain-containing protein [Candidatus Nanohaloarchaeota archaeon QJJ-5]|nr:zinc ribbon domain-containing protein [Candidatus Nanohaloarchaeota archaeon QJJ-5]